MAGRLDRPAGVALMFAWLAARRRARLVAEPFPPHWDAVLRRNVAHFAHLPAAHQVTVRECVRVLVAEKLWGGRGRVARHAGDAGHRRGAGGAAHAQ